MKVVHITKLPDGGASLCAMRISHALKRHGVDSKMLFMQGAPGEDKLIAEVDWLYEEHKNVFVRLVMKTLRLILRPEFERLISKRKKAGKTGKMFFTSPVTGYTNIVNHPLVKQADIIHLHWVSDFVDFPSFFSKINKPVVWTIHDENPGLGGFHYSLHKKNASPEYLALDKEYEEIKRKALRGKNSPHLVAISEMMYGFIKSSNILKECPVTLIHNGVDCDIFHPMSYSDCRDELKIQKDQKTFLFSSFHIEDERKGLHLLIPALDALCDEKVLLVCLGNYKSIPKSEKIEIRCVGLVKDSEILVKYYSAADYFVLSSFQEAFAQTPLEAMACGTPVISFPCSGAADLINEKNGCIADDFTVSALENAIRKATVKYFNRQEIRENVKSRFSYEIISEKYIALYNSLIKK